jgi:TRAP-type C4-dicarboxylate transport system permease small subunit
MIFLLKQNKHLIISLLGVFISTITFAQNTATTDIPMADQMRADGKIWVVLAVIAVIFVGLILFLISIDSKVTKLEKQLKK